jgi:hypothetical protein
MMYGVVKNQDGKVVGQHAIDPTAPGGMQAQMARIATAQSQGQGMPMAPQAAPVRRGPGPAVPTPGVMPAQVFLRFQLRMADGTVQQVTRAIQLSPAMGIPPGVYVLHPHHSQR